jgi:hypothetical protein
MSIEKNETPVFLHLHDRYSLGGRSAPEYVRVPRDLRLQIKRFRTYESSCLQCS